MMRMRMRRPVLLEVLVVLLTSLLLCRATGERRVGGKGRPFAVLGPGHKQQRQRQPQQLPASPTMAAQLHRSTGLVVDGSRICPEHLPRGGAKEEEVESDGDKDDNQEKKNNHDALSELSSEDDSTNESDALDVEELLDAQDENNHHEILEPVELFGSDNDGDLKTDDLYDSDDEAEQGSVGHESDLEDQVSLSQVLESEAAQPSDMHAAKGDNDDEEEEDIFVNAQQELDEEDDNADTRAASAGATVSTTGVYTDDDSSAFVDRMELADAYDEGTEAEELPVPAGISPGGGGTDDDDSGVADQEDGRGVQTTLQATTTQGLDDIVDAAAVTTTSSKAINNDMVVEILTKELKWKAREVKNMRSDIAAVVAAKKLRRPQEGMPINWYISPPKPPSQLAMKIQAVVPKVFVPVCFVAVAVYAGQNVDFSNLELPSLPIELPFLGKGKGSAVGKSSSRASSTTPATVQTTQLDDSTPGSSDGSHEKTDGPPTDADLTLDHRHTIHEHSIKPFPKDPVQDNPDHTWLDKIITKVENVIKAIFRAEL